MNELKSFIAYYCKLNDEELNLIVGKFVEKRVPKGRHLLKQGQICSQLVYTVEGSFRIYYNDKKGKEITTWLVFNDMLVTEWASFITQQPTKFNIQAVHDSTIAAISHLDLQQLYIDIPKFQEFGRRIAEEVVVGAINRVVSFQYEPADKRYEKLINKSEYLQKIPLKYIASFLGVTDTSLSRIRRKRK
jgi:CRP-like cAMP-binding protein